MFAKLNTLSLKTYAHTRAFICSKLAGSDSFAAQAVLLLVVAALAGVMMLARTAIGQKIMQGIAAIAG